MQRLEVSGVVRPLYGSLGVKGLRDIVNMCTQKWTHRVPIRKNVDSIPDGGIGIFLLAKTLLAHPSTEMNPWNIQGHFLPELLEISRPLQTLLLPLHV